MSEYTPKVGDKVRATLGESVIVGRHERTMYENGVHVTPDCCEVPVVLRINDGWRFERIQEVPSRFGAVIRRADGKRFTRVTIEEEEGAWVPNGDQDFYDTSSAVMGGFSVLFDGVDE